MSPRLRFGLWVAAVGGCAVSPVLFRLVAPWAGRVADLHDRRRVLALGSVARGVTVLGMVLAAAQGSISALETAVAAAELIGVFGQVGDDLEIGPVGV